VDAVEPAGVLRRQQHRDSTLRTKIAPDCIIDLAVTPLVLTFTAEGIGCPCNDDTMFRVAKTKRALCTSVPERRVRCRRSKSVGYGVSSVSGRVTDESKSEINLMLKHGIECPGTMPLCH